MYLTSSYHLNSTWLCGDLEMVGHTSYRMFHAQCNPYTNTEVHRDSVNRSGSTDATCVERRWRLHNEIKTYTQIRLGHSIVADELNVRQQTSRMCNTTRTQTRSRVSAFSRHPAMGASAWTTSGRLQPDHTFSLGSRLSDCSQKSSALLVRPESETSMSC